MNTLERTIVAAAHRELKRQRAPISTAEDHEDALTAFRSLSALSSLAHIEGGGLGSTARAELLAVENEAAKSLKSLKREQALPTIAQLLGAFDVSNWLKSAVASAVNRDAVDAAKDAELLHLVLAARSSALIDGDVRATPAPGREEEPRF